jgi:hypothetical protein
MQCVDYEAGLPQDRDPLSVAGMELHSACSVHASHVALRLHQFLPRVPGTTGRAHGGQDAGGMKHQPAARPQQAGRLRYPAAGIAPQARAALRDGQVKARARKPGIPRVGFHKREPDPEPVLAPARGTELSRSQVDPGRPRPAPGQPGGQVRGPAAKLHHIQRGQGV